MTRSFGLDLARCGAISLVLICHFVKRLEVLGFYGVELFFALSGFLIGNILYKDLTAEAAWPFSRVKRFWLRRWWRTLPNYYLFLLIHVVFHYYYGGLPVLGELPAYLVFLQTWSQGNSFFYGGSWSLCIEEWFYLLFPLALFGLTRCGLSKKTAFLLTTTLFLLLPPVWREFLLASTPPETVRVLTLPRLDAIFYGVAISFLVNRVQLSPSSRIFAAFSGLILVLFPLVVWFNPVMFYRVSFVTVPAGFALTMPLLSTLQSLPTIFRHLESSVRNISLWSYSIYLCHLPVLLMVYAIFGASREHGLVNAVSKVLGLAATLLVARFVYLRFEVPMMQLRPPETGAKGWQNR